jgi:CheY-like chemotaxis protein
MDGYELMRSIRQLPPDKGARVPALALTGFAGDKDRSRAMRAGFDVHLAKPVSLDELIDVLEDLAQWAEARHAAP